MLNSFKKAELSIGTYPAAWPYVSGGIRQYLLRFGGSTYVFHYVEDGPDQIILRIWHGREQRPF